MELLEFEVSRYKSGNPERESVKRVRKINRNKQSERYECGCKEEETINDIALICK